MKVIIAGSQTIKRMAIIEKAIADADFTITEVVSGAAPGVDTVGAEWARINDIPVREFPADWRGFGRSAGMIRNQQMAEYADALIAVWDGKSRGTSNMIDSMRRRRKLVYVITVDIV